jgi:hypothetical protein
MLGMKSLLLFFTLISCFPLYGKNKVLFLGNYDNICFHHDSIELVKTKDLPVDLCIYSVILLFSNAESLLTAEGIEVIKKFITAGGGVYCGADNWPLQAESNQVTMALFSKECWGNFDCKTTQVIRYPFHSQLFSDMDFFPAGTTTTSFPLDYRLKVEVWQDDHPLILSGELGKGKIIIDGGYSRFYCPPSERKNKEILSQIIFFLSH